MRADSMFLLTRPAVICCAVLALVAAQPVLAQQRTPIQPRQQAQRPSAPSAKDAGSLAPELTLQASAASDVRQDTVRITLAADIEAATQAEAGRVLGVTLDDVVKRTRDVKEVEASTSGHQVWPNTNNKGRIQNWRGRAEITLESRDFAAASALASALSDKMAISRIGFLLSRQAREAEERKLLDQAAQAFRDRAQAAAAAFGFHGYRVRSLALSGGGSSAPSSMMMEMAPLSRSRADVADVPLEAGTVPVGIAVSGTVVLQ